MRRTALVAVLTNLLATVALAQQNELSVFVSQFQAPDRGNAGYGVSFSRQWMPRFSTAIAVAVEDPVVAFCTGGIFTPQRCSEITLRTYPVDLTGRFHFVNDTRWKPYIGLGLRYLGAPDQTSEALALAGRTYSDHVNPEIVGGLQFLITPSFGIGAEVKGLFRNPEDYDSVFKISGAAGWRF